MQLSEYQFYRDLGWQHKEIAKEMGIGRATLYEWINEKHPKQEKKDVSELLRFIESSLLGDGSIVPLGNKCCFSMSSSNREYLEFIQESLRSYGMLSGISEFLYKKEKSGFKKDCIVYILKSRKTVVLNELRSRWYPEGVKQVPSDFVFIKQDIIRMYVEDGSRDGKSCKIFWGAKDDEAFERFCKCCEENYVLVSKGSHKTGGKFISLKGVEVLPGYEYKLAGVAE